MKRLKGIFTFSVLITCALVILSARTLADQPRPRPSFMPSTPPAAKAIADYTAAEVVGAVITRSSEFPDGHPYDSITSYAEITNIWLGAKEKTNIDAMIQIVLDAPSTANDDELETAFKNVRVAIQEVMDVSDADKADAFVRIVGAQTDPLKAMRAKTFAREMFGELLDPRLFAYDLELLDDATQKTEEIIIAEGVPREKYTVRDRARRSILRTLNHTLKMEIDETPFKTADEAANCAALKTWLTTNWTQVSNKCDELKVAPDRVRPTVIVQPWDARW